jgi:hypothetical protein
VVFNFTAVDIIPAIRQAEKDSKEVYDEEMLKPRMVRVRPTPYV